MHKQLVGEGTILLKSSSFEKLVGTRLGNYRVERLIEKHKWGPSFGATTATGKSYVIRFVGFPANDAPVHMTADSRIVYLGRFQQEASLIATLQHPHILPLLDYGSYQGMPYLVYPDVPLVSLRALLGQQMPTDVVSIGRYLYQIASALEYAHEHAVLHRNLSTQNIFLQNNRQLLVGEFGVLRIHELSLADLAGSGKQPYVGSSESSAPEQLLGKPVDAYTDIYALGAVLYRLLAGHPPFEGKTREEVARQHLYARVPSLSTWRPGLPVELDHMIAKAMSKEPLGRFSQPGAFVEAYYQIVAPDELERLPGGAAESLEDDTMLSRGALQHLLRSNAPRSNKLSHAPAKGTQWNMRRRRVVTALATTGTVVVAGLLATRVLGIDLARLLSIKQPDRPVAEATMTLGNGHQVRAADIALNSAQTFPLANKTNPGVLVHLPDNRFVAFDAMCTHAGCSVHYEAPQRLLVCPCHGSAFDPAQNAAVVQGPATSPLTPIPITVNPDGIISIKT